ncbi:MAG: pyrroloquinoline quinone biosynthesis peptide chaperone PqqD [Acidobacteria bacterium]|nr:pyrroloquinoline quinone biosynthesis peptide chaperone PqqD [Acidobacteriota bacterium]
MSPVPDSVPRLERGVGFRRIAGKGVVLVAETSKAIVINGTGARILELVDGKRSLAEIVDVLIEEFDAPRSVLEEEVAAFLERAEAGRIVAACEGSHGA